MKKNKDYKGEVFFNFLKICLLIFLFLRPYFDGFSHTSFNHISSLVLFIIFIISIIMMRKNLVFSPSQVAFFLFIGICGFLLFLWPTWYRSAREISYLFGLVTIWVVFKMVFDEKDFPSITVALFSMLAVIIIYGIDQYFGGLEMTKQYIMQHPELIRNMSDTYLQRMASNRIFSRFVYPNTFAGYLLILYPVVLFSIFYYKKPLTRVVCGILLALILPVFAATESMGGWFCFVIVSVLILLYLIVPKRFYFYWCFALLIVCSIFVYMGIQIGFLPKIGSLADRINYWISATNIFRKNPVYGIGPGNFSQFHLMFKVPGAMEAKFAHNIIFEIAACTGIVGIVFFLATGIFFILRNLRNFLYSDNLLLTGFIFGVIGFFLHCLVDFDYANPAITAIAFAFLGIIESVPDKHDISSAGLTKFFAGGMIIAGVLASTVEIKTLQVDKIIENIKAGEYRQENPIQVLEQASRIYPEPELFFIEGEIFVSAFEATSSLELANMAITSYEKAIKLNPDSSKYHRALARILVKLNRNEEAEKEFLEAIKNYPTKALYNLELGLFYRKIGEEQKAKIYLEKARDLPASSVDEAEIIKKEIKNGEDF
ncbi:MAG TPA: O-antigen ligase family protein [bacterium]|nr:O-antigen ligase family protein [bacterium]